MGETCNGKHGFPGVCGAHAEYTGGMDCLEREDLTIAQLNEGVVKSA